MKYIDLHVHTNASDGELSPRDMIDLAVQKGLSAIAITDHDTTDGIKQATEYARKKGIEVIPGIEIGCYDDEHKFGEVHILGYFINYSSAAMDGFTKEVKEDRVRQKKEMVKRLNGFGFDITFEEVESIAKGAVGRPHVAKILLKKHPSEFSSIQDVFDKYIGTGKPAYVERWYTSMQETIKIITDAGGLAVLAHPGAYKKEDSIELIRMFKSSGGNGIETIYPYHKVFPQLGLDEKGNIRIVQFYRQIAKENGLLETGGSDFHRAERGELGCMKVSMELLDALKEAKINKK